MEIGPESILNSARDPARHCPERGRGHTASTTDSAMVFGLKPAYKMFYLYLILAVFLCLPTSIYCTPAYHEQSQNSVDTNEGSFQNKYEQYYRDDANIGEKGTIKQMSLKEKLREKFSSSKHDRIKAKPITLKAEISLDWRDMKDFLRGLVKGSATTTHHDDDNPSHRSARDTESQMDAAESGDGGPGISNLSPAAVVGTIVGGTVGVFLIVVLTVIFCSYRNYSSLEIRQRTADVYGGRGRGYPQAERRM